MTNNNYQQFVFSKKEIFHLVECLKETIDKTESQIKIANNEYDYARYEKLSDDNAERKEIFNTLKNIGYIKKSGGWGGIRTHEGR